MRNYAYTASLQQQMHFESKVMQPELLFYQHNEEMFLITISAKSQNVNTERKCKMFTASFLFVFLTEQIIQISLFCISSSDTCLCTCLY